MKITKKFFESDDKPYYFHSHDTLKDKKYNIYAYIDCSKTDNKFYVKLGEVKHGNTVYDRYAKETGSPKNNFMVGLWTFDGTDTEIHNHLQLLTNSNLRTYKHAESEVLNTSEAYELTSEKSYEEFKSDVDKFISKRKNSTACPVYHNFKPYSNVTEVIQKTISKIDEGKKFSILDLCPRFGKTHTCVGIHKEFFEKNLNKRIFIISSYVGTVKQSYQDAVGMYYPNSEFIDADHPSCETDMHNWLDSNPNHMVIFYLPLTGADSNNSIENNKNIFEKRIEPLKKLKSEGYEFGGIIIEEADFAASCEKQIKKIKKLYKSLNMPYAIATSGTNVSKLDSIGKKLGFKENETFRKRCEYIMDVLDNPSRNDAVNIHYHTLNNSYMKKYGLETSNFEHISSMLAVTPEGKLQDEMYFKSQFSWLFQLTDTDETRNIDRKVRKQELLDLDYSTMIFVGGDIPTKTHEALKNLLERILPKDKFLVKILNSNETRNADVENEVKTLIEESSKKLVLISTGMANRSFSIPEIKNIILLVGDSTSDDSITQKISRGLTPIKDKTNIFCNVVDFRIRPDHRTNIEKMLSEAFLDDINGKHVSDKKYITTIETLVNEGRIIFDEYFVDGNNPVKKRSFEEIKTILNSCTPIEKAIDIYTNNLVYSDNYSDIDLIDLTDPGVSVDLSKKYLTDDNIESQSDKKIHRINISNNSNNETDKTKLDNEYEKRKREYANFALNCNKFFRTYKYETFREQINASDSSDENFYYNEYNLNLKIIKRIVNDFCETTGMELPWTSSNIKGDEDTSTLISKLCGNYESLLNKFLSKTGDLNNKSVCLACFNSPYFLHEIIQRYPNVNITVLEDKKCKILYKDYNSENICKIFYDNNKRISDKNGKTKIVSEIPEKFKDMNKKFDLIIMNPPYDRDLHLKIVAEAIKKLKDDDSVCVCLQPNYLSEKLFFVKNKSFNKFKPIFENTLLDVEIIENNNLFDAAFEKDLIISIYKTNIEKSKRFNYYKFIDKCPIFDKTIKLAIDKKISNLSESYDTTKQFKLVFPGIHGHVGQPDMLELTSKNYEMALNVKPCATNKTYAKKIVSFDTEKERKNFYDSINTTFFKYWVSYVKISKNFNYDRYLPFMEDYTEPWTNERFYVYFNITPEEQKIIEETMAKYSAS